MCLDVLLFPFNVGWKLCLEGGHSQRLYKITSVAVSGNSFVSILSVRSRDDFLDL